METLYQRIGNCGPFQVYHSALTQSTRFAAAWSFNIMMFGIYEPRWRCADDKLEANSTLISSTNAYYSNRSSCDFIDTCEVVEFDPSSKTVVSEFSLICERSFIPSIIICILMVGMLVGVFVSGQVGELLGRKVSLYGSTAVSSIASILAIVSPSWQIYAIFQFFNGAGVGGIMSTCNLYSMEFLDSKWRARLVGIPTHNVSFALFTVAIFLLRDWVYIHVAASVICALACVGSFWTPESLRWLLLHGKRDEAEQVVEKILKINKSPMDAKEAISMLTSANSDGLKETPGISASTEPDVVNKSTGIIASPNHDIVNETTHILTSDNTNVNGAKSTLNSSHSSGVYASNYPNNSRTLFSDKSNNVNTLPSDESNVSNTLNSANTEEDGDIAKLTIDTSDDDAVIDRQYTYLDLFRHYQIRIITIKASVLWFSILMTYFALNFSVKSLTGDFYVNALVSSSSEIPALLSVPMATNVLGRRKAIALYMLIGSLGCFTVVIVFYVVSHDVSGSIITYSAFISKASVIACYNAISVFTVELYPTAVRNVGVAFVNTIGRVGAILSPFLIPQDRTSLVFCYIVLGVASFVNLTIVLSLPETKDKFLQDKLTDDDTDIPTCHSKEPTSEKRKSK